MTEELAMEKEVYRDRKAPAYVSDLAEEEYPMFLPETHMIPKLHKQKPKGFHQKHSHYRHKHPKPLTSGVMSLDDFIANADQNWMKHLDGTAGLEAAFSHNYPIPAMTLPDQQSMSLPSLPSRHRRPHHRYPPQDHNRFLLGAPIPTNVGRQYPAVPQAQPAFFIPPPMQFMSPLQAQATVPLPYYMPYVPQPQQPIRSQPTTKANTKTNTKTKHSTKSKSNSAPKIIRI